ncbi:MAG TPA: hypothetical protein DCM28_22890 [Phycisphaerales bacterium]|nr:hypothetical protein [Phycisphaerales bacterium]HCD31514.1 hypothetical protein [Phycisphaerales bacterium]|tara:strand:- start:750 stop:992 length:243 start_codon:yes stop_codon:yes gene_type:complete
MKRFKPIINKVIDDHVNSGQWHSDDPSRNDSSCVLEALLAEYGIDAAVDALKRQGFAGDYRYLIKPLYEEAILRRSNRTA